MSEPTVVKEITRVKAKDPKKVEAARKLGQISKQLREQKMRARIAVEKEAERREGWDINYVYLIGIGGLFLAALSVYCARAEHKRETQRLEDSAPTHQESVVITNPDNFLDSFD